MTIITAGSSSPTPTIALVASVAACSGGAASVMAVLPGVQNTNFIAVCVPMPPGTMVQSVNDSLGNRFIQQSYSYTSGGMAEIWGSRGSAGGTASVTVVFNTGALLGDYDFAGDTYDNNADPYDEGGAPNICINVSAWSNVWYVSPTDVWSQNTAVATVATAQSVTPRAPGDLFLSVVSTSASISGPSNGYSPLSLSATSASTGSGAAYFVNPFINASSTSWNIASSQTYAVCHLAVMAGQTGRNPLLQFPETLIQISEDSNFLSSFSGVATFTDVSSYLESMTLGPIGRQHELDRISSSQGSFVFNGRDGSFNPWNTTSFLSPGGLDPMSPVRVVASWSGVTSPIFFAYIQSITPNIIDVLNNTVTIDCYDVLQLLSLAYISGTPYANAVLSGN